jgi:nucleoside-diphosphate-sugar epimerase
MLVLVTGGTSAIAGEIASRLTRDGHIVRLTDRVAGADSVLCTLEADDATAALMDGVDHIVHVEPCLALPLQEDAWLDICTRCSYNLLTAASEASIDRVTLLNTMDIFMPYDLSLGVLPDWQPLPSTLPAVLGPHLAEYTALEFALVGAVRVLTARLGALHATEAEALAAGARWWISPAEP